MTLIPLDKRGTGRDVTPAIVLGLVVLALSPANLAAQGLPVQNGPMLPVAIWWIGSLVLGLVMAYGVIQNRRRTRAEKELTERATKKLYAEEARDEERDSRAKSGSL
jgi:phosphate/sulfate permease